MVPIYHKVTAACNDDSDCDVVRELKTKGQLALESRVRLDTLHDVAVFLNRITKGLTFIPLSRKKTALEYVIRMIASIDEPAAPAQNGAHTEVST